MNGFRRLDKSQTLSTCGWCRAMASSASNPRQHWLSVLSRANLPILQAALDELGMPVATHWLRRPETGAVMVRGRMGGSGAPFNMGEMTVTRAAVRLADGTVGMGYAAGRSHRQAELVAQLDALLQQRPELAGAVLEPIEAAMAAKKAEAARKAAATKVEFFTLVRGENAK